MNKRFRAWDGEEYWYADKNLLFIKKLEALSLELAPFDLKDLEMFTGKMDSKGAMIYENDLIQMIMPTASKLFQVVWSDAACGFRKVPYGMPMPKTKIDEAFMEIIGTIHS